MNNSTLRGLEIYCHGRCNALKLFAKALVVMLFLVFVVQFNAKAQGPHPSCNISGPLEAVASGPDLVITIQIAHSTANPGINYQFMSNTSNAFIRTTGPISYNAATNSATQQITVSPGTSEAEFNIKLQVTTPNGVSTCSKSVSVAPVGTPIH